VRFGVLSKNLRKFQSQNSQNSQSVKFQALPILNCSQSVPRGGCSPLGLGFGTGGAGGVGGTGGILAGTILGTRDRGGAWQGNAKFGQEAGYGLFAQFYIL
jgi:hypothetical protein